MMSPPSGAGPVSAATPEKENYGEDYIAKTASEEMIGSLGEALGGVTLNSHANGENEYAVNSSFSNAADSTGSVPNENLSTVSDIASNSSPWGSSFPSAPDVGFAVSNSLPGIGRSGKTDSQGQQGSSLLGKDSSAQVESYEERSLTDKDRKGFFQMDGLSKEPTSPVRSQGLELFLSQSPSKSLGDDLLKFRDAEPPPALQSPDTPVMSRSGSVLSLDELGRAPGPIRRRTDSPACSATGTSASSRSNSPFSHSNTEAESRRTIQAYYGSERSGSSGRGFAHQQVHAEYERMNSGLSSTPSNGSINMLNNAGYASSQLGSDQNSGGYTVSYEHTLDTIRPVDQQYQQPATVNAAQVLYMAVPTPDGRGQMLQPVQMVQLPGQPSAFVLPTTGTLPTVSAAPALAAQQPGIILGTIPTQNLQSAGIGGVDSRVTVDGHHTSNWSYSSNAYEVSNGQYGSGHDDVFLGAPRNHMSRSNHVVTSGTPADAVASLYSAPQRPPLDELLGHVRRLSRDQVGCRLLQQALDEEGPSAATLILNEGISFWGEAMVDPFGNYLFQKILEKISPEERVMLIKSVSARLVNASLNLHGTRSVQKVVELCSTDEASNPPNNGDGTAADILTRSLTPAAARLCIDSHGNHVIQRILLKLNHKHSQFVFDAVAASVGDVARHRHGCCVIQRCLDSPPSEARSHLVHRIVDKSLELMQDAYGNYVVQYVLDVCSDEDVQAVCESVVGKVSLLAIQKFSSNVMEKCLERSSDMVRQQYLQELSDPERIRELMMDPFGNYVVQRALSVANHSQAVALVEAMRPHLVASQPGHPNGQRNGGMRNTAGGRRIMSKICRRFPNFTLNPDVPPEELYTQNKGHHRHNNPATTYLSSMPPGHHGQTHYVGDPRGRRQGNQLRQQQQPQPYYDAAPSYYDHLQTSPGYHPPM